MIRGCLAQRRRGGFTLVEVMIALSILFAALVVLLRGAAMNIAATQRAQMLTAATELARAKMYDIEETLLDEGFQELDQTLEGEFDEEGWPNITWEAQIVKIELPNLMAMQGMGGEGEEAGEEGAEAGADSAAASSPLGGLLGMAGGLGGEDGGAGAGFIQSQFEIFRNILQESIRKVTLTVRWRAGGEEEELVVDCYFTEPEAISRVIAAGPGGEGEGEDDGGDEDGGGATGGGRGGGSSGGDTGGGRGGRGGKGGGR